MGRSAHDDRTAGLVKKRSVNIHGHQTSITLENEFWDDLKSLAASRGLSMNKLVAEIDDTRAPENNLSSALRLYILKSLKSD